MKYLCLTALAFSLVTTGLSAQEDQLKPGLELAETVFGSIEDRPNQMVDMGEFTSFGESIFVSMDSNESDSIDYSEFDEWDFGFNYIAENADQERAYATAKHIIFAFWDRDGDGSIGLSEYHQAMISDFRRADIDHNALLTRDEFLSGYIVNIGYRAAIKGE